MLTIDQIAKELIVSRNTVVNLIKKGSIGAIKIGDQYRIPDENFRQFISNSTLSTMKPDTHLEDLKTK